MHRIVIKRAAPPGPVKKAVADAPTAAAAPPAPPGLLGSAPQPHAGDKRQRDEPGATTSAQPVGGPLGGGADAPAADDETDEVRKRRERLAAWRAKQQASKPAPPGPDSAAAVGAPALRVQPSTGPKVAAVTHGTGLLPLAARPPQAAPAPPPRKGIALVKAPVVRVKSALQSLDDDAAAAGPPVKPLPVPASALEATAEAVAAFAAAAAAANAGGADGRRASRWASNPPSAVDLLEAYPSRSSSAAAAAAADEQTDDFEAYLRSIGAETAGPGVLGEGAAPGVMTAEELEALLAGVDESAAPPPPESDDEEGEEDDPMAGPGGGEGAEAAAPDAAAAAIAPAPDAPLTSAQIKKAKRARAKARAEAEAATAAAAAAAAISSGSMPAPAGEDFDDITGAAERAAELAAAAALADGSAPPPAPAVDPAAAEESAAAPVAEEDEETSLFKGEEWEGPTRSALDQVCEGRGGGTCRYASLSTPSLLLPPAQLRDKIAKKDLKAVDHAAVQYAPFRKALYIESR